MEVCSLSTNNVIDPNTASRQLQNTAVYNLNKLPDSFSIDGYNYNNELCVRHVDDGYTFNGVNGDTLVEPAEARFTSQIGSWAYGQPQYTAVEGVNSLYQSYLAQGLP